MPKPTSKLLLSLASALLLCACSDDSGGPQPDDSGRVDAIGSELGLDAGAADSGDAHLAGDSGDPRSNWIQAIGGPENESAADVIFDDFGNSYLVGVYKGQLQIGTTTLDAGTLYKDIFVVKFDPAGNIGWVRALGTDGTPGRLGLTTMGLLITGDFYGSTTFGGPTTYTTEAYNAPFVLELSRSDGALKWAQIVDMGSEGNGSGAAVVSDGQGGAIVLGEFETQADFGGIQLSTAAYSGSLFLARLDATGSFSWAKAAATPQSGTSALPRGLAVNQGAIFVCGALQGTLGFGATTLTSTPTAAFVARASSSGEFEWATQLSQQGDAMARAITVSRAGSVFAAGEFKGSVTFGGSELTATGGSDIFLTQLNATSGAMDWAKAISSSGEAQLESLGTAFDGSLWAGGAFSGEMTLGGDVLSSGGTSDLRAYAINLDAAGAAVGGWMMQGDDFSQIVSLRPLPFGGVVAAGNFEGSLQSVLGPRSAVGMQDAFVINLPIAP